jgi:hypothetical protein
MNLNNTPGLGPLTEADLDRLIAKSWLDRRMSLTGELAALSQVRKARQTPAHPTQADPLGSAPVEDETPSPREQMSALWLLMASIYSVFAAAVAVLFFLRP